MNQLSKTEILSIGLMMFSIFFGAGNLIFPPALGQAAGSHVIPAMIGFLATGVGLPLLGVTAIALQGGKYIELINKRTYPWFATALLVILYLTIGPVFAMPRTGAVSFEIGIRPFLSEENMLVGQGIYTFLFFALSYYLALNPNKLIDRVGKMLTPMLIVFLIILFAKAFVSPLGEILDATGSYIASPFAQGFQDGYQTMDLLASIAVGTLVVTAVRMRGVTDNRAIGKVTIVAGLISVFLMSCVYLSLGYLGATSAGVLGHSENGGQLLADAVAIFFGSAGNIILAVIIGLACLTTCCGISSGTAWFFNKLFKNRISYERLLLISLTFSFLASNLGLTQIIALAVPFLVAIYPLVIVFVLLSLFDNTIGWRESVYHWAMNITLVFAVLDGLNAAGLQIQAVSTLLTKYVPFYEISMGWVVPAILGAGIGFIISTIKGAPAEAAAKVQQ
ncbi:MAG: branched-chain amino acid transport system II carrier protein [Selenomonadaceae bacterium]|nr:branched-chain amino acid transport system II carrier protein [Selenomonadaceae bacterium]